MILRSPICSWRIGLLGLTTGAQILDHYYLNMTTFRRLPVHMTSLRNYLAVETQSTTPPRSAPCGSQLPPVPAANWRCWAQNNAFTGPLCR